MEKYYANPEGYRRAKQSEVTSEMTKAAVAAVFEHKYPLKHLDDHGDFIVVLETHYNDSKGYHRGATIFLPDSEPMTERNSDLVKERIVLAGEWKVSVEDGQVVLTKLL